MPPQRRSRDKMPAHGSQQSAVSSQRTGKRSRKSYVLPTAYCLLPSGRRGQSILEYAVFTAAVSAALIAMNVYVKRAIQANLKHVEQQINADVPP